MMKIYVCMAVLCINLHESEADNTTVAGTATKAKLDFWTPDSKFKDKSFGNRRKIQDDEKEDKVYRHGRVNPYARFTKRAPYQNTSLKYRGRLTRGRHTKQHVEHPSRKPPEMASPRTRDKSKVVWSRAKRWRHKGRKHKIFSTRLMPNHLMQQPNEDAPAEIETTQRGTTEEEEQSRLSPYALEKQMRRMLSHYDINISIEVIGRTVEYNNILLYKLSDKHSDIGRHFRAEDNKYVEEEPEKKIVFIVHGLSVMGVHELAALHYDVYFSELLYYYMHHLDYFDIFLIPMANPDGYITALTKPFWNKNMSPQSSCAGVALDRNFDVAWNREKVYSPCSQRYPGPAPFSEAETKAVRDVLHHYGHKIIAYIHVHAGTPTANIFKGDAVLYPKGYTDVQSDDDKYIDLRGDIDETMRNASLRVMSVTVDTLHNWYGKVHGSSVDYAATVYGIPYALEFVMQLYRNWHDRLNGNVDFDALTVIWKRIIDVVFDNLWKHLYANEVR